MVNLKKVVVAAVLVIALIMGVMAYNVFKTPAQASAPIEAIPLAQNSTAASDSTASAQPPLATAVASATANAEATAEPALTSAPASTEVAGAAEETATTGTPDATTAAATAPAGEIIAQIVPEESEVRFVIDEVLNNAPKTVVGTTSQVAGELAVNPDDPTKSRVGVIQVNARTLTTDSNFRNRAIANQILQTNQYEFITFTPTELLGLPSQGAIGESYTFQIVGDLTIRDVTREATFDVTVTPESTTRLTGTAQTTIRHADFGITIPSVRQVASVSEEVRLEIDFVAVPS